MPRTIVKYFINELIFKTLEKYEHKNKSYMSACGGLLIFEFYNP